RAELPHTGSFEIRTALEPHPSIFIRRRSLALPLLMSIGALCVEPARLRRASRFARTAHGRFAGGGDQHLAKLVETVLRIPLLVAEALAGDDQFSLVRQPRREFRQEPAAHLIRQRPARGGGPAQHSLARNLVDVLSPGPRAADIREVQFVVRNSNLRR